MAKKIKWVTGSLPRKKTAAQFEWTLADTGAPAVGAMAEVIGFGSTILDAQGKGSIQPLEPDTNYSWIVTPSVADSENYEAVSGDFTTE